LTGLTFTQEFRFGEVLPGDLIVDLGVESPRKKAQKQDEGVSGTLLHQFDLRELVGWERV
jgi:hypothetical protein